MACFTRVKPTKRPSGAMSVLPWKASMSVEVGAAMEGQWRDAGGFLLARTARVARKKKGVSTAKRCHLQSQLATLTNGKCLSALGWDRHLDPAAHQQGPLPRHRLLKPLGHLTSKARHNGVQGQQHALRSSGRP